jgi:hypothetical protein
MGVGRQIEARSNPVQELEQLRTLLCGELGSAAAERLGIDRIFPGERIWGGGQWFYLAGILNPALLASEIDSSVLVGFPAAKRYLGFDGHPTTIYVRSETSRVAAVQSVLAATANPEAPNEVGVSQPSAASPPAPPRARRHQSQHPRPVPRRSDPARPARRRRRRHCRRACNRQLRAHQTLDGGHPDDRLGGRTRGRDPHRRRRRPASRAPRRPHVPHRSTPNRMTPTAGLRRRVTAVRTQPNTGDNRK